MKINVTVCVCLVCVCVYMCVLYADKSAGYCHAPSPSPTQLLCKGQAFDHNKEALLDARHKSRQHAKRIGQKNDMRQTCCDVPLPVCVLVCRCVCVVALSSKIKATARASLKFPLSHPLSVAANRPFCASFCFFLSFGYGKLLWQ